MQPRAAIPPPDEAMRSKMLELKVFLNENMTRHFTTRELAKRFATNTTSLKTHFHTVAGMGLFSYLLLQRMLRANELLRDPGLSISEIADRVGYHSASSFIRAYKKLHGETPARKRRR